MIHNLFTLFFTFEDRGVTLIEEFTLRRIETTLGQVVDVSRAGVQLVDKQRVPLRHSVQVPVPNTKDERS